MLDTYNVARCMKLSDSKKPRSEIVTNGTMAEEYLYLLLHMLMATLLLPQGATPLMLRRVSVPQYRLRGEMALLECQYELEDDALYSVKWYKDDEEFYRYVPKSSPAQISYKVDGIKVDHHLSNDKQVVLRNVNLKSSGVYRCEVSAEAPSFASAQREGRMEVVFLPKDGPHISGEEKLYQIGDEISLNCTSGKSYPASVLHWYINDHEVQHEGALVHYPLLVHTHGLLSSSLGLRFNVLGQHFFNGHMKLRCVAKVSPVLWQGDRESVVSRMDPSMALDNVREALFLVKGSSSKCSASIIIVATLATFVFSTVT